MDIPNAEVLAAADDIRGLSLTADGLKNPHIIVGAGNRCLCGMYDGKPVHCRDVLAGRALVKDCTVS